MRAGRKRQAVKIGYREPRPTASARGYDSRWSRYRLAFLGRAENALCVRCLARGRTRAATDVDHVTAVSGPGDPLFWTESNHQPLCHSCHSRKTNSEDRGKGRAR